MKQTPTSFWKNRLKNLFKENQQLKPEIVFAQFISESGSDLALVGQLRNPKTSVCGKRVEQKTLSFKCSDCSDDPHHMICNECFVIENHKGHKFIMFHKLGGCCDCGDERVIKPSGSCANHKGIQPENDREQLTKIPCQLAEQTKDFFKFIILYYSKNIQKSSLNYPISLMRCKNLCKLFSIDDKLVNEQLEQLVGPKKFMKKLEFGVFLYNSCVELMFWFTKSNMPFIGLISNMLMESPNLEFQKYLKYETDETFLDLIVKNSTIIDNGHIESKQLEDILYSFHANEIFNSSFQQSLIKYHESLTLLQSECSIPSSIDINIFDKQLKKMSRSKLDYIKTQLNTKTQFTQLMNLYLKELKLSLRQEPNILFYYESDLSKHHSQYTAIEHQFEFFSSPHISNFYDTLRKHFNSITKNQFQDINFIFNTTSFLNSRISQKFFPQVVLGLLDTLSPKNFQMLNNGQIIQDTIPDDDKFFKNFLLTCYIYALSEQEPVDQSFSTLKKSQCFDFILNYLYVQQNLIDVVFQAFQNIINSSTNKKFNLNLTILMLKYTYRLVQKRNLMDSTKLKSFISEQKLTPEKYQMLSRLFTVNATTIDRIFAYFLSATYFSLNLGKEEFVTFLQQSLSSTKDELMNQVWQAVDRAVQSYFMAQASQDSVYSMYNGVSYQVQASLKSLDTSLIKMFLFLNDGDYMQKFALALKYQVQDIELNKHKLILDLLLSDQDLLNVCGSLSKELPLDLSTYFKKFIRSLFVYKNYHSFTTLKQICINAGILKSFPFSDFIFDICELDGFVRDLKLKTEFYDQKLYEPYLLQHTHELKGAIIEILLEKKDYNIDPTLGNGIKNDFAYQYDHVLSTMGPIRRSLWVQFLKCPTIFSILFSQYQESKIEPIFERQSLRIMTYTIYAFAVANENLKILNGSQINMLVALTIQLKNYDKPQISLIQKVFQNTQKVFQNTKVEENIDIVFKILEETLCPTVQVDIVQIALDVQTKTKLNKQKQLEKFQKKFIIQQEKFNQNFKIQEKDINLVNQEVIEICQGCKLPIEANQEQCFPGLLDYYNSNQYMGSIIQKKDCPQNFTILNSCRHRFHLECIQKISQNRRMINGPIWLQRSCPVCKQAINIFVPIIIHTEDNQKKMLLIKEYFHQTINFVNVNQHAAEHYFSSYCDIDDHDTIQYIIFLECNISIVHNLFNDMFINYDEFSQKCDNVLLANLIQVSQIFLNSFIENIKQKTIVSQQLKKIQEKYTTTNDYVVAQVSLYICSLLNNLTLENANDILSKVSYEQMQNQQNIIHFGEQNFESLTQQTLQLIFDPSQKCDLSRNIHEVDPQKPVILTLEQQNFKQHTDDIKNRLGTTFKDFYMKYIQLGCSKCSYYPIQQIQEGTAQLFVCLLCEVVLCPIRCDFKKQYEELGNLNYHAKQFHCSQSIFISVTTGETIILVSPITILNYKNLFYDRLGQRVKILELQPNWDEYKLDERELSSLVQILRNKSLKQIVRNEIDKEQGGFIDERGLY